MEARPKQHSSRWNVTVLEQNVPIRFPPFQCDNSNSEKGSPKKGRTNDNSYTNIGNTTLVSSSVRDVNTRYTAVGTNARFTGKFSRKQTRFSSKRKTTVSGLESYKKSLDM